MLKRVSQLEKNVNDDHEQRIADLEAQIKSLKDIMTGGGDDAEASEVPADSKQLAQRIKYLADQLN
jgi:predicted  nucleic acid-binding Zn-ribbon protein